MRFWGKGLLAIQASEEKQNDMMSKICLAECGRPRPQQRLFGHNGLEQLVPPLTTRLAAPEDGRTPLKAYKSYGLTGTSALRSAVLLVFLLGLSLPLAAQHQTIAGRSGAVTGQAVERPA